MEQRDSILEYINNPDGTVTVMIKGQNAGTFGTKKLASDAVDAGISKGIKIIAEKIGLGEKISEILDK